MRLFVAVGLDDARRRAVGGLAADLARRLASRGVGRSARWVEPANLHLTVRFIGEVGDEQAARIQEAVRRRFATPAFDLGLGGLGVFPPVGPPRVLWVGVTEGEDSLAALHEEVEARLEALGEPRETRPFSAHLTLARFKEPDRRLGEVVRAILRDIPAEVGACRIDRVTLYESRLAPTGPTYTPLVYAALIERGA